MPIWKRSSSRGGTRLWSWLRPARDDAHRPLAKKHSLAASLSYVETRQVGNGYTIQFDSRIYQIARADIRAGLRGAPCGSRSGSMGPWRCVSAIAT